MTMQQYILLVAQKKKTEAPNQEVAETIKISFLFHSLGELVPNHVTLTTFHTKQQHFTQVVHNSSLQSLTRHLKSPTQELWICLQCHFLHLYTFTQST